MHEVFLAYKMWPDFGPVLGHFNSVMGEVQRALESVNSNPSVTNMASDFLQAGLLSSILFSYFDLITEVIQAKTNIAKL